MCAKVTCCGVTKRNKTSGKGRLQTSTGGGVRVLQHGARQRRFVWSMAVLRYELYRCMRTHLHISARWQAVLTVRAVEQLVSWLVPVLVATVIDQPAYA